MKDRRTEWLDGAKQGIPIACGYFFVSFTFGILGASLGFRWWESVLISMTNLTSAGQVAGVQTIAAGGSIAELALSQFVINVRYSLMGISLSQNTDEDFSGAKRAALGFGITDEIYAVAVNRPVPVTPMFMFGLITLPYFGWALGTLAGALFGNALPTRVTEVMTLAIYGMFIAIVLPKARTDRGVLGVALLAAGISCLLYFVPALKAIPVGFAIIICAIAAAVAGALLFPVAEAGGGADA
ncbi:MAG: AzlC family ABC transporter permease [Lachnospiraceae bacterium]|nr:AzlC family ABC transporter permease [Lachnospiraceae bacterium]